MSVFNNGVFEAFRWRGITQERRFGVEGNFNIWVLLPSLSLGRLDFLFLLSFSYSIILVWEFF